MQNLIAEDDFVSRKLLSTILSDLGYSVMAAVDGADAIRLRVAERILHATLRMQHLENVLTICAYTKKINFPEEGWQTIEEFMKRHLGITLTHGIEPDYYEQVIVPQLEDLKKH